MLLKVSVLVLCMWLCGSVNARLELPLPNHGLDQSLYENVLDEELCSEQLGYLESNTEIRLRFLDAGIRMPRGVFDGNLVDLGNYYQCLGISHDTGDSAIEGKYCSISLPLNQEIQLPTLPELPELPEIEWPWPIPNITLPETRAGVIRYQSMRADLLRLMGASRISEDSAFSGFSLQLAVCIPKSCTTRQALDSLYPILLSGLEFNDNYCRLPNDKPWVPADYVATVIFSLIGLLTIICTWYDVRHTIILKRDPKQANALYKSFSVYSNTKSLVAYKYNPKVIQCLDGIRVIAMMWVIVGHSYSTQMSGHMMNPLHILEWLGNFYSIWITAAPISVDTFFTLSGLLLVYTTSGKMGSKAFLPRIPMFYLNRLLRMFPILAAGVLLQASWFNRVADGPSWSIVLQNTHNCRTYWWTTLLHIQNYVNPGNMCLAHSWYLAVDTQLYIVAPLIMFWVFFSKRLAWVALTSALAAILIASTAYNAVHGYRSVLVSAGQLLDMEDYMYKYYVNTLTRGSPFFVGMLFGYILYSTKDRKLRLSKSLIAFFWLLAFAVSALVIYISYPIQQAWWDQPVLDVLINSFMRPAWAACIGWMVFACQHGYGGFINWLLSLRLWKVPSKLSYAMYIFHYQLIFIINSMGLTPFYFQDNVLLFRFMGDLTLAVFVAFLVTVVVDSPFATLIKLATGGAARGARPPRIVEQKPSIIDDPRFDGVVNPVFTFREESKTKL